VYELSNGQKEFRRTRRATDRAEDRVGRASDHGDRAAMRIAGAQLEQLLRERAAYRRTGIPGSASRRDIGEVA
jgi:hypothetical protein